MKKLWIALAMLLFASCSHQNVENATSSETSTMDASLTMDLIMPDTAQKTSSGFAYVVLENGDGAAVDPIRAYKVRLKTYDIMTGSVDDAEVVMIPAQAGGFYAEIMTLMHDNDLVRVWGESQGRVWDIELLGVAHEFDLPDMTEAPENATELNGAMFVMLEPGEGALTKHDQAVRMHATRWNLNDGVVLESSRLGEGMVAILNNEMYYQDPVHAALLSQMAPGAHARVWIPGEVAHTDFDILEDVWLVERMPYFDVPSDLVHPQDAELVIEGAWMRVQEAGNDTDAQLQPGDDAQVDMTCWNSADGKIIMSSALTKQNTTMHLDDNLGVWFDFMQRAKHGMTFWTWTEAAAMPQSVGIDMVCRVIVK